MNYQRLIVVLFISLFFSCSDDSDDFDLVGKWKPKLSVQKEYFDDVLSSSENYIPSTKTFYSDSTGIMTTDEGYSNNFTWMLEKNKLTIVYRIGCGIPVISEWQISIINNNSFELENTIKYTVYDQFSGIEYEYKCVSTEKYYK